MERPAHTEVRDVARYTVLLIEPDTSLRRLIALGLLQRGMQVVEASSLAALAEQPVADPDLLVLDLDTGGRDSSLQTISTYPYLAALPTVILAWEPPASISTATLPLRESVAKPFDARTLHATIENVLITSTSIARVPARQIMATAASAPTASLSPLITAAGLLLTVVGLMMLQMLIAGAGLLVMLVALLWWTLGKRPEHKVLLGEAGQPYAPSLP